MAAQPGQTADATLLALQGALPPDLRTVCQLILGADGLAVDVSAAVFLPRARELGAVFEEILRRAGRAPRVDWHIRPEPAKSFDAERPPCPHGALADATKARILADSEAASDPELKALLRDFASRH